MIFRIPSMVQNSDKVQLGTPATKPPNSARPQTPPKAPWVEEMKPNEREAKYSARKVSVLITYIKLKSKYF